MNPHSLMMYIIEKYEKDFDSDEQFRFIQFFDEYFGDYVDDYRDIKYAMD